MTAAWDKSLDWWEFTAARFLRRHGIVPYVALVIVLAVLAAIVSTWAYAQPQTAEPETEYVIVRRSLLNDAIELIQRQDAEIEALRARCPVGAAAI